jgi:hypothetical protein
LRFRGELVNIRSRHLNGDTGLPQLVAPDVPQNGEHPAFDIAIFSQPPNGADSANIGFLYQIFGIDTIPRKRQSIAVQSIDMLKQHIGFGGRSIRSEKHMQRLSAVGGFAHMS